MSIAAGWEHFTHDADIGIRGCGMTQAQAFEQAGCALTAVITKLALVRPHVGIPIRCNAEDLEYLFCDWLNALIYEMATRRMLFSRYAVNIERNDEHRLAAMAWGEPMDLARHHPAVEIKGATYTALSVSRNDAGLWCAQCVVDV